LQQGIVEKAREIVRKAIKGQQIKGWQSSIQGDFVARRPAKKGPRPLQIT